MVLLAPLLGLGSIRQRASDHLGWATRVFGTAEKPSVSHELMLGGYGGCEMVNNRWMVKLRSDDRRCMEMAGG